MAIAEAVHKFDSNSDSSFGYYEAFGFVAKDIRSSGDRKCDCQRCGGVRPEDHGFSGIDSSENWLKISRKKVRMLISKWRIKWMLNFLRRPILFWFDHLSMWTEEFWHCLKRTTSRVGLNPGRGVYLVSQKIWWIVRVRLGWRSLDCVGTYITTPWTTLEELSGRFSFR